MPLTLPEFICSFLSLVLRAVTGTHEAPPAYWINEFIGQMNG